MMIKKKKACEICGKPSYGKYCVDCEMQVRDYFVDAICETMDWMNLSYEDAARLGESVMDSISEDEEAKEDAVNHLNWLRKNKKGGINSRG